jgi:micrococcal nuclease
MYEYKATVIRVIDGDTVDVDIDLGFSIHTHQRVRVNGIDAPERYTPEGRLAAAFLSSYLSPGTPIVTSTVKAVSTEKYGRYLADIILPNGFSVSSLMLDQGHAKVYHGGARL